ncbi:hypothetical protein CAOG_009757 [Capsaspora owczarzaki ATCC 30864]|uniref:Apple domain-containing protein n=1 Tax=Capsaspora owczarzaki (strain ATCC 30864) TaxID=595528 RepID=A0A0D2WQY2_CAPO3|nr:hypothetical protein CAOG_009757 [Capsaspora owczarzaki ATCC 30864]
MRATLSPVWWLLSLLVVARVSSGQEQAACTFCTCVGSPVIEVKNCNDALITIPSNIPTTVKNMWIDNSFIRFIRPAAFRDLSSLTVLGLYGNQISVIPANAFSGLVSLKVLDLRENGISDLSARAFTGLSALTLLELQNNLLSTLPPGLFQNLSALTQVDLSGNSFGAVAPPSTYRVLTSLNKCDAACATCYGAGPDACCAAFCLSCNSTKCTSCYVGSVMVDGVCGPPAPLQIIAASFPATALEGNEIQGVITLHNYGNTSLDNVKLGMYPGYGLQLDLYDQQQKPVPYLLQAEVQQAITRLASGTSSLDGYIDDIGQVSLAAGQTLAFPVKFVFQGPAFPLLFFSRYDAWSLLVQDTSNSVGVIWRMEPQETNIAVSPIANDAELVCGCTLAINEMPELMLRRPLAKHLVPLDTNAVMDRFQLCALATGGRVTLLNVTTGSNRASCQESCFNSPTCSSFLTNDPYAANTDRSIPPLCILSGADRFDKQYRPINALRRDTYLQVDDVLAANSSANLNNITSFRTFDARFPDRPSVTTTILAGPGRIIAQPFAPHAVEVVSGFYVASATADFRFALLVNPALPTVELEFIEAEVRILLKPNVTAMDIALLRKDADFYSEHYMALAFKMPNDALSELSFSMTAGNQYYIEAILYYHGLSSGLTRPAVTLEVFTPEVGNAPMVFYHPERARIALGCWAAAEPEYATLASGPPTA